MNRVNKRVNGFFLCLIIVHLIASILVSTLALGAVEIGIFTSLLLTQLLILVPSFIFLLVFDCDISEWLQFRRIRISTVLMVILFTFLTMPFISLINVLSQLFTTNTAVEMSAEFSGIPSFVTIFMVGMFGPFCEEFTFRGIIFGGFRKSGYILGGAVLSALYFGLMHLNLNQFSYALVLGFLFCLLVEGTGSIFASITAHMVVNIWNVGLMLVMDKVYSGLGMDLFEMAQEAVTTDAKLAMIGTLLVISVVTMGLAFGLYIAICRNEGKLEHVISMFHKPELTEENEGGGRLLTVSGYIAIAVCLLVIFGLDSIMAIFA